MFLLQAWSVFAALAIEKEIGYDQILFSQFFNGDEAGLRGMDRAGLISLVRDDSDTAAGPKLKIKAGRPLLQAAFTQLIQDRTLAIEMEIKLAGVLIQKEREAIKDTEQELYVLSDLLAKSNDPYGGGQAPYQSTAWGWLTGVETRVIETTSARAKVQ